MKTDKRPSYTRWQIVTKAAGLEIKRYDRPTMSYYNMTCLIFLEQWSGKTCAEKWLEFNCRSFSAVGREVLMRMTMFWISLICHPCCCCCYHHYYQTELIDTCYGKLCHHFVAETIWYCIYRHCYKLSRPLWM